jgi:hypothetical protein
VRKALFIVVLHLIGAFALLATCAIFGLLDFAWVWAVWAVGFVLVIYLHITRNSGDAGT